MNAYFADMADNPFLATGLMAGLLASIACGVVGPWVVTRRIVFLAGAIAHIAIEPDRRCWRSEHDAFVSRRR